MRLIDRVTKIDLPKIRIIKQIFVNIAMKYGCLKLLRRYPIEIKDDPKLIS